VSAERSEMERVVACLERLVVLLATAPHLSHMLPPLTRTASLLAPSGSSLALEDRGGEVRAAEST
jgi:hypothetical protein